jgi:CYTH domain-containing protein
MTKNPFSSFFGLLSESKYYKRIKYKGKVSLAIEIERKFLVKDDSWRKLGEGIYYRQGYLSTDIDRTVRIRTIGEKGFLTIKGRSTNATRTEFEYEIPIKDAEVMLDTLCKGPLIEKTRFKINVNDLIWEIDEFWGENAGLIIAEIELEDNDKDIILPEWVGKEVTEDQMYYNANLVKNPYKMWDQSSG